MGFQKVRVNSNWSDPANAWDDIQLATGMKSRSMGTAFGTTLEIHLWEGRADRDDYAVLAVGNINGNESTNYRTEFESVPAINNDVYILCVNFCKAGLD